MNIRILSRLFFLLFVLYSPQAQACGAQDFHKCAHGIDTTTAIDLTKCPNGICVNLSWQNGADLDIHAQLPTGVGSYIGSNTEAGPSKNSPLLSSSERHVGWQQKQVIFAGGQATASLDHDNRLGGIDDPLTGQRIENLNITGNIPTEQYRFAGHNYNFRNLADPSANYTLDISTDGKGFVVSNNHLPNYQEKGFLARTGDQTQTYIVNYVNNGFDPHALGTELKFNKDAANNYNKQLLHDRKAYSENQNNIGDLARNIKKYGGLDWNKLEQNKEWMKNDKYTRTLAFNAALNGQVKYEAAIERKRRAEVARQARIRAARLARIRAHNRKMAALRVQQQRLQKQLANANARNRVVALNTQAELGLSNYEVDVILGRKSGPIQVQLTDKQIGILKGKYSKDSTAVPYAPISPKYIAKVTGKGLEYLGVTEFDKDVAALKIESAISDYAKEQKIEQALINDHIQRNNQYAYSQPSIRQKTWKDDYYTYKYKIINRVQGGVKGTVDDASLLLNTVYSGWVDSIGGTLYNLGKGDSLSKSLDKAGESTIDGLTTRQTNIRDDLNLNLINYEQRRGKENAEVITAITGYVGLIKTGVKKTIKSSSKNLISKLDKKTEELASSKLGELEESIPNAHFKSKHGTQTTSKQQHERATQGIDPVTKKIKYKKDGTIITPSSGKFYSSKTQLNAIERATQIYKNILNDRLNAGFTLREARNEAKKYAEIPIKYNEKIGAGFKSGTGEPLDSSSVQVWFNNEGSPITAFPILGQ